MNDPIKYDPEDIEKLLRNKSFNELLEKEREFVSNHISSEDEYDQMRYLLLDLEKQEWDEIPELPKSVKVELISRHKKQNKTGIRIWLNSLFAFNNKHLNWYQKPGFQLGFASVLLLGIVFVINQNDNSQKTLAELNKTNEIKEKVATPIKKQEADKTKEITEFESSEQVIEEKLENDTNDLLAPPPEQGTKIRLPKTEATVTVIEAPSVMHEELSDLSNTMIIEEDNESTADNYSNIQKVDEEVQYLEDDYILEIPEVVSDEISTAEPIADEELEERVSTDGMFSNTTSGVESVSNNRGDRKKKESFKTKVVSSISLNEQMGVIDQLFVAY